MRARLAGAGVTGAPVLYAMARAGADVVPIAGTDLGAGARSIRRGASSRRVARNADRARGS